MSAPPATPTASPKPTGKLRLSAFAVAADDQHHPITRKATMELRHIGSDFSISTNIGIPCLWRNIPTGEHRLSLAIPGFRPSTTNILTVLADATNEIAVAMQPLPARVRFAFPATNVVFDVYNDTRLLGDSTTAYDLTPFVPHYLTFKADGWRTKRVKVHLAEPGTSYHCPIEMERVEVAPRTAEDTAPPFVDDSSSVAADRPATKGRQALPRNYVLPSQGALRPTPQRPPAPELNSTPAASWQDQQRQDETRRIQELTGVSIDWRLYSFSTLHDKRLAVEQVKRIEEITGERLDWRQLSFSQANDKRMAAEQIQELNRLTGAQVDWHLYAFSQANDMRMAAEQIAALNQMTGERLDWRQYTFSKANDMRMAAEQIAALNQITGERVDWHPYSFSKANDMRMAAEVITEINQRTGRNYQWRDFTFSKAYDLKMKLGL
jgi:hypothetical protein